MTMSVTGFSELSGMTFPLPVGFADSGTFDGMAQSKKRYPPHPPRTADLRRLGYKLLKPLALRDRLLAAFKKSGEDSMRKFSSRAGLDPTVFQAIIKSFEDAQNVRGPSMVRLEAIAKASGLTVAELLTEQQYPLPPELLDPKKPGSGRGTPDARPAAVSAPAAAKATTGTHRVDPVLTQPQVQLPRDEAPLPQRPVVGQIPDIDLAIAEARKLGVKYRSQISEETWRAIPLVAPSMRAAGLLAIDGEAVLKLAAFLEEERLGKDG